jgi:hypothetical protein
VGGVCVDLSNDPRNCGSVGNTCGPDQACVASACVCRPGLTAVGSNCVDLQSDPANCGSVGNACGGTTPVCSAGTCIARPTTGGGCGMGLRLCGSSCVDVNTDPLNCGGCGNACAANEICDPGNGCSPFRAQSTCTTCPCTACVDPFIQCQAYGSQTICVNPG